MKWALALALLAVALAAAAVLFQGRAATRAGTDASPADRGASEQAPASGPALRAPGPAAPTPPDGASASAARRANGPAAEPTGDDAPATAAASATEGTEGAAVPTAPTRSRRLRPGETFTPLTDLKAPTREEREAAAAQTRQRLEASTPLRTTWAEAALPDVLRALSAETGLVIALGPRALGRGSEIRVREPLEKDDPATPPTTWRLLEALAQAHGLELHPWKKGVMLREPRDPAETRVMIHVVGDLLQAEWARDPTLEAQDRPVAVLPALVREAAGLDEDVGAIRVQGSALVVRQRADVQDRIAATLTKWREDPAVFRTAWKLHLATRHPTVSGAPPRETPVKDPAAPER